jgi:hypothetical protein
MAWFAGPVDLIWTPDLSSTLTIVMFLPLACFSERARCVHIELGGHGTPQALCIFFFISFPFDDTSSHRQKWISRFFISGRLSNSTSARRSQVQEGFWEDTPAELEGRSGNFSEVEDWERLMEHDTPLMISAGGGEIASWLSIVGTGTPTICEGRADAQKSGCAMGQAFAGASVSLTEQITRSVASVLMARKTTVYTEESE